MKTAFINSMCHEIRTPLNAINGFSDLLLEGDHDHNTRREFREQIWASTTALTTLLENMLEPGQLRRALAARRNRSRPAVCRAAANPA